MTPVTDDSISKTSQKVRWEGLVNAPDGLNLRPSPSTDQPPLRLLSHETRVEVVDELHDWLHVVAEGQTGYVFAAHVLRRSAPSPVVRGGAGEDENGGREDDDLAPPPDELVITPPDAAWTLLTVAEVWNRYGGILTREAQRLGIDPTLATALLAAESSGRGYGPDGRLLIRFEVHVFYAEWGKQHEAEFFAHFRFDAAQRWQGHQWRANPAGEWQELHRNSQPEEWAALELARQLDDTAALRAISMGLAQIMGFNFSMIGYGSVQEMFDAFQAGVRSQINGFFRFVESRGLVHAVQSGDLRAFAAGYNGPGQADKYAAILHSYAAMLAQLRMSPAAAAQAPAVVPSAVPMPPSPRPGVALAEADPALYAAWRRHIEQGLANNQLMFKRVLDAFMGPYWTTVWTYRILIGIGVGGFIVAAALGLLSAAWPVTAVFGGLSVIAFLTYFLSRPLQALEENLQFITWLGVVYNTYWTRLANAQNADTFQADIAAATDEFVVQVQQLVDAHGARSEKRPNVQQP
jgi:hypothetical protein